MLLKVLSIVLMVVATLICLMMEVFFMAGGANAEPRKIVMLKWMMLGTALLWLIGIGGGIWAMIAGRDGLAMCLAAAPTVVCITAFIVMWVTEW